MGGVIIYTKKNQYVYQFRFGYMINPYLRSHRTTREQNIRMFSTVFELVFQEINAIIQTKTVKVMSMMMLYHNRYGIHYKVIGSIFYTFLDRYVCLDYLGIFQRQLSFFDNTLAKTKFNNFQDLVFLKS